ncbi:hypothetical protein [Haladaptatus sp. GCM10025893]|uniref:hypothetical protein n=1 Tax=Haladaptatus sp. GCM10025893 TaxID=3252659 RepID=UPI0036F32281
MPGLYFAVRIGRPRFLGLALYLVMGVVVFDLLVYVGSDKRPYLHPPKATSATHLLDWRSIVAFLLVSVGVTIVRGPGVLLYTLLTLVFTLLMFKALFTPEPRNQFGVILFLTGCSALLAIFSQVFTVGFYITVTDGLVHTSIIANIVESGNINDLYGTRFWGFLVYHVFSAVGVKTTDLAPRVFSGLSMAVLFQAALVSISTSIRRWVGSSRLALVAGVLVGCSVPFLTWGTKVHYQSLSFVFFSCILLAFAVQFTDKRAVIPTTLISIAWLATHHLSVAMAVLLTGFPIATATVLAVLKRRSHSQIVLYLTFIVTFVTYWTIITNEIASPFQWIFLYSPAASAGLPTTQMFIQQYESISALIEASVQTIVSYSYFTFWLAASLLGLRYLIRDSKVRHQQWLVLLSGFAIGAAFYFPTPLWIPLRGVATLFRWGIIVLPLLIVVPAYGIVRIAGSNRQSSLRGAIRVCFVVLLVFTSIGSAMTSPSLSGLTGTEISDQKYLSESDLEAIWFTETFATESQSISGSSFVPGYLFYRQWKDKPGFKSTRYDRMSVTGPEGRVVVKPGLSVFQVRAFHENAVKLNVRVNSSYYGRNVEIRTPISADEVTWNLDKNALVYTNGATVVQYKP